MFEFIKKVFFTGLTILASVNPLTATPLKCTSMNIQEWKVKPQFVNLNRDEPVCFFLSIETSKCNSSCNNINNPYAELGVPDVVRNLNVKLFKSNVKN